MILKLKQSAKRNLDRLIGECVHSHNIERFRRELDAILRDGFEPSELNNYDAAVPAKDGEEPPESGNE